MSFILAWLSTLVFSIFSWFGAVPHPAIDVPTPITQTQLAQLEELSTQAIRAMERGNFSEAEGYLSEANRAISQQSRSVEQSR